MKIIFLVALAASLSACSVMPAARLGAHPADPNVPVPLPRYASVTAGTLDYKPVEPKSWLESNQGVGPKAEVP